MDASRRDAPRPSELPPTPSMLPSLPRRGLLRRLLRASIWTFGAMATSLASLVASVAYHASLQEARSLARVLLEDLATSAMRGELRIGRVEELTLGRARFTSVVLLDDQGRMVVSIPELTAWPDWRRLLLDGTIRIAAARAERPFVRLYTVDDIGGPDPDGLEVSLVRAFLPAMPGEPGGEPVQVVIDGISLLRATVVGDVPRFPGLVVEDLDVVGRIEIAEEVRVQVFDAHGRMTAPYGGATHIDRLVVGFTTDWDQGLDAFVTAHREGSSVRARVRVTRPGGSDATPYVWIRAHLDPLKADTLATMGFAGTGSLVGRARGHALLAGPADRLELDARLLTDGGEIVVSGVIESSGRYRFDARTDALALEGLVRDAPSMLLSGRASVEIDRSSTVPSAPQVTVDVAPFSVSGYAIPGLRARVAVESDALAVDEVLAPDLARGAGGSVRGRGRVGFDGSIDLAFELDVRDVGRDPNVARLVPGARGAVRGRLRLSSGPRASRLLHDFDLDVRDLRYGAIVAQRLTARGQLRGELGRPVLRVSARGDGLRAGAALLGTFSVDAHGGPAQYEGTLSVRGGTPLRSGRVELTARAEAGGFAVTTRTLAVDFGSGAYRQASPTRLFVSRSGVRFDEFVLEGGAPSEQAPPRLHVEGSVGRQGADGLTVQVSDLGLSGLGPSMPATLARLSGRLDASIRLDGSLDALRVSAAGGIADLTFDGVRSADVAFALRHADGVLEVERIDATVGDRGSVRIDGRVAVPLFELADARAWRERADVAGLEVAIEQVGLPFVLPLLGIDPAVLDVSGKLSLSGSIRGTLADPEIPALVLILDRVAPEGWTPIRLKLELSLRGGALTIRRLWLADADGALAQAHGSMTLPFEELAGDLRNGIAAIARQPWELYVRLEPRSLDDWPRPFSRSLPSGVRVGADVVARGGPEGTQLRGDASVAWVAPASSHPCARREQPILQVHLRTEQPNGASSESRTRTVLDAGFFADGRRIASARASAATPYDAWLGGLARPSLPAARLDVVLDDVPLDRLPWTCARGSGRVNGRASATLFSSRADLDALVEIEALRVRDEGAQSSRPYHVSLVARTEAADWTSLSACAVLTEEGRQRTPPALCPLPSLGLRPDGTVEDLERALASPVVPLEGEAILRGAVPIRFVDGALLPELALERAVVVQGRFSEAHLEPLLAFVPGIREADAVGDGTVALVAESGRVRLAGGLDLASGRARILALGQHLTDIEGFLHLRGNRIVIDEDHQLRASDPAGRVAIDGEIGFEGLTPGWADLHVFPDGFPFRREGAVLASLAGHAGVFLRFRDDRLEGQIRTTQFDVRLPDRMAGSVMPLEARRDVLVIGEDAFELATDSSASYPYVIRLDATAPFTVRRNDFEARVTADLAIRYAEPVLTVAGSAVLREGTFEIFGKRFAITRGSLLFREDAPLDPVIDLVATYALPGRSGASIGIEVGGALSDLQIAFTSTETNDVGQILSMLVSGASGRSAEETAQQAGGQAANFVAGLAAGVLTLTLRRELGEIGSVVPAVSVETAGAAGTLRARAFWDASLVIPDFLRDVVLGASVEGFFTADQGQSAAGSSGSSGPGGGVTFELQFPYGLGATGTYVPPQSWGADLLWQP